MEYLAVPYTHPDPKVMAYRFRVATQIASKLFMAGRKIYSPISHSHPIAQYGLPKDWEFWQEYDREMLSHCSRLIVVKMDGWLQSKGIKAEVMMAHELGIEIEFMEYF